MKISIYCDELYPSYGITNSDENKYSITVDEYADYLEVQDRWEAWQHKLATLKPDDYVVPLPPTEEELELRRLLSSEEGTLLLQTPDSEAA